MLDFAIVLDFFNCFLLIVSYKFLYTEKVKEKATLKYLSENQFIGNLEKKTI